MHARISRTFVLGLAAVVAIGFALPAAVAHENANHGTIKVHDEASVEPAERNQPHVCSPFWIEGFDMSDGSGRLVFESIPPTTNPPEVVLTVDWTADSGSEEDGFHFNHGPLELDEGHYRVEAFVDDPEPHPQEHSAKSKVFWVDCEGDGPDGPGEPTDCPGPASVTATANEDLTVTVSWDAVDGAESYNVYRATGGGDFAVVATADGATTTWMDEDVVNGEVYRYFVTAMVDGEETDFCDTAEVTAIPDLPSLVAMGLAGAGGLVAYAFARRRSA